MILDETIQFLRNVPPFQFLDDAVLRKVAVASSLEFYPRGEVVLSQDGPASDALRIIKKGGVKVHVVSSAGEEVLIDYRGEGDAFGFLSLVSGDKSRASVTAVEDTICYLIPRKTITSILDVNPAFTEFFVKSFLSKYIDKTFQEMEGRSLLYGGGDRLLFTTRVGDIGTKEVVSTDGDTTIREAAGIMAENRVSSVVVTDRNDVPVGIVTDRDLRDKVVARGRDVEEPVRNIMSTTLVRVDSRDYCFEAVLKMVRYNIHHVLIIREGRLAGVMTNHDLMIMQGTSPLSLSKDIESQQTIEGLVPVAKKINGIVGLLLKEGARASNITKVITEINDRLVRKVLQIAEKACGRPPVTYSWIGFGSEGRKEQTFRTDQDNAIIYADADPADEEEAKRYFETFARFAQEALVRCGFPPCSANYMAGNPKWCQPLRVWKRYFSSWVSEPTPEALIHSLAFFDFRSLAGDPALADALRDHLHGVVRDHQAFIGHIANLAVKNRPPLGFFKSFVVEKDGVHKDELNLKVKGIAPLVDAVRLCALERGVRETSTLERIDLLRTAPTIVQDLTDELEQAFEFLMLLRIHHQYSLLSQGKEPDNFINPDRLSNLEKRSIKEAFHLVEKVQDLVIERYKSFIW